MEKLIGTAKAAAEVLFLLTAAPLLLLLTMTVLVVSDLRVRWRGRPQMPPSRPLPNRAVSVVIPSWNGRHHLEKNLPSVLAAIEGNPGNEVIVVDNASTDGTADFLRRIYPAVRIVELEHNHGFGGGSNAGFRAARHDIVVLLNNDMRVDEHFLEPLLEGFRDPRVFAVTAQIHFSDPEKRREETGLTHGFWLNGRLHLRHLVDEQVTGLFPTFYAGGGSTAYDRGKFFALGGFDPLLEPFYLEDTDISYLAWKRGWIVLYHPGSIVYHEHRGTIGKHFSPAHIQSILEKNHLLFSWKNIHEWKRLAAHFCWLYGGLWVRRIAGPTVNRPNSGSLVRALARLGPLLQSRARAQRLAAIDDTEAFRRPLGGYFRDRFGTVEPDRPKLNVLFVSPYPMEPPLHGGAVFMNQTVRRLAGLTRLHLLCLLDEPRDLETNRQLAEICSSAEFMVRWQEPSKGVGGLLPHAAETFYSHDLLWRIQRAILVHDIDVVQLEYTQLATYGPGFHQIAAFLFEHDVYFQSVLRAMKGLRNPLLWLAHAYEYLRALRFERRVLGGFDAVQVCTAENRRYLESYAWNAPPIVAGLRAGIDVDGYRYIETEREPDSLLFVGNFRHPPNQQALEFFVDRVFPAIRRARPGAHLVVIGAQAPAGLEQRLRGPGIEFLGRVADIRDALGKYAIFVSPILSGSGVRVKLLEAFAAGIPVVSTTLGAEGLAERDGEFVELADTAERFAEKVLGLLENPEHAAALARRARQEVEEEWNTSRLARKLEEHYRLVLRAKRRQRPPAAAVDLPFVRPAGEVRAETSGSRSAL